ncbi:MAG TPA: DUF3667 domain-containing protein [Terriglobales bacterium]|nr:DUF3667 domain-containing protein [Terriglobales bacterium]
MSESEANHRPLTPNQAHSCANCGHPAPAAYCPQCGEQQPGHHDLSLKHFFHEAFHELLHLDSRLFRTLKHLLFTPGLLTVEYFAGCKARYFRPLRLYLVAFALSFFLYSLYKPVTLYDFDRAIKADTTGVLEKRMEKKAERLHTTPAELSDRVSQKWAGTVSLLQLVYIFLLAGVLKLVYLPKHKFYVEHLVFCLHYYAFNFLVSSLLWPVYRWIGVMDPFGRTGWLAIAGLVLNTAYLYFALKRVYQDTTGVTAYRAIMVWLGGQICFVFVVVVSLFWAIAKILR